MAIETELNYKYTSGADAVTNAKNAKAAQTAGKATTNRGTLITKSNTEFDKNSFLKILAAQLSNLDPTQNQDSSAYVAQMAQFASMEQMQNLNTTMSDYAYHQMIGKKVILDDKSDDGTTNIQGYVTKIKKKSTGTFANIIIDGKEEEVDVSKIIGVVETTDSNTTANNRAALNSDFLAASALADKKQNVVIATLDSDKKTILIKGKATGAYIDTVNSATVKIKIDVLGSDGKPTGESKTYDYGDIVRAGDLTDDDMNVSLETAATNATSSSGTTNDSTSATSETKSNVSDSTESPKEADSTTPIVKTLSSSAVSDDIVAENATLAKIAGA